ncbi:Mg2+/Co2+ transporter CorC [Brevibacillus nitrificans]|nr:Mg2+/Co2+ transporter CorC [Brevibacillus nitrificans]
MDNDRPADYIRYTKLVCEKAHTRVAVIGKERGEISGVIAMGLIGWVPMRAGGLKRILRIADGTGVVFV